MLSLTCGIQNIAQGNLSTKQKQTHSIENRLVVAKAQGGRGMDWESGLSSVQLLSHVRLFATPWTTARRPPCPSPIPGVYPNSCPLSQWCHLNISSSVIPFSSCPQSFPTSGSFQMSQLFTSSGQSIGVSASASVLPMNIQDWFPLGLTS